MPDLTLSIRVGYRYRVIFSVDPATVQKGAVSQTRCEWSPKVPRQLSAQETADYRAGRDRFYAELATLNGQRAAIVEPSADGESCSIVIPSNPPSGGTA